VILLKFAVIDARPSAQTAGPSMTFRLNIEELSRTPIHAIALRCQVRIDPRGRRYAHEEQMRLYELFGDSSQWDRALQMVTWAHTTALVPAFAGQTEIDLRVPCTYDLEIAAAKYLHAIRDGAVPLVFLFSGTAFSAHSESSGLSVEPVPWDREASYRLPASVWHSTMDRFFPGGGWMRVSRETLDRLQEFRGRNALVSWDDTIDRLLLRASEQVI
jgi:uncharacterized protein DUF6084